jgi:glutamate-1-semialdehyde-2,1-aminomutase
MRTRVHKSLELFEEAKKFMPGGVQSSRRPSLFAQGYPIFTDRAKGSHVWDVDGNEYIDWMLSYGPIVLGHSYLSVDQAVMSEISKGFCFDLTPPLQIELAKKLARLIPCCEMVLFATSGSEATLAAVRIARIFTGRYKIVRWGYHGWFDWSLGEGPGIPAKAVEDILSFDYNDLDSLQLVLERNHNDVACIIMQPIGVELPKPGFLQGVRDLATKYHAVLVFDEIRSWPRVSLGGAQKHYGVIPDLTTISKGMANGYPISAVVGRREIMAVAERTHISGTFFMNTLGIRAALATLAEMEDKDVVRQLWKTGEQLLDGLKQITESKGIRAAVMGLPPMPFLVFGDVEEHERVWPDLVWKKGDPGTERDQRIMSLFYSEMIQRGVFFHPRHHWYTCFEHTEEDVRRSLVAAEEALDVAQKACKE